MKKIICILLLLFSLNIFSQDKELKMKKNYSCEELTSQKITDPLLYDTLPNGKKVMTFRHVKGKIFKITIRGNGFFYVSKRKMKEIRRSMRKNKCNNVIIENLETAEELGIKLQKHDF